jgi:hypothetical protein
MSLHNSIWETCARLKKGMDEKTLAKPTRLSKRFDASAGVTGAFSRAEAEAYQNDELNESIERTRAAVFQKIRRSK